MSSERWFFDESTRKVLDENRLTVADAHSDAQDGRLLAAAPAMLAALKVAARELDHGDARVTVQNAIRDAEGR